MSSDTRTAAGTAVLSVENLGIDYKVGIEWKRAVRDVSFSIGSGESLGLVGESGCGKTTVAMAIMHYLPRNGRLAPKTSIKLRDREIKELSGRELRDMRVNQVSMVYQDPGKALNPSIRIGRQVADVFELMGFPKDEWGDRVVDILEKVQIADPTRVVRRYPHQLSGGMLQRVVIAMAIASEPELLILDEPTTGLDATVEAEVLELVENLRQEIGTSLLFISHSLAVIRKMCDRVGVLYAGRLLAEGPAESVFTDPRHPYTVGLLRSLPTGEATRDKAMLDTIPGTLPPLGTTIPGCIYADRCPIAEDICRTDAPPPNDVGPGRMSRCHFPERSHDLPRTVTEAPAEREPSDVTLIDIANTSKTFMQEGRPIFALTNIDLAIKVGETVALVGESGSGKSTLAKVLLGIHLPDDGAVITLGDEELTGGIGSRDAEAIRAVQMVFQNPDSALNRRHSVRRIVGRAVQRLRGWGKRRSDEHTRELITEVRMGAQHLLAKPSHLSGGLKQRVAIARAFAGSPSLVVLDEPTSALDVSVQAAIINLLSEMQAEENVAYLFISHDLNVVRYLADRVAVMYLGRLMEVGSGPRVFGGPHHPYTEALLSAKPDQEEGTRIKLSGEIPASSDPPPGCVFQTRCHRKIGEICETVEPDLVEAESEYFIRCHIPVAELGKLQVKTPAS